MSLNLRPSAQLSSRQGATGVALPFGEGLNLQEIEPMAAWVNLMPHFIKTTARGLMQLRHRSRSPYWLKLRKNGPQRN